MCSNLMIGTAQFGQKYGIASGYNQVSEEESKDILKLAYDSGIRWIDTAGVYGCAETILGKNDLISNFNIVTKVFLNKGLESPKKILEYIRKSIINMGIKKLYGVLVNDPNDLILDNRRDEVFENILSAKNLGLVEKIGVSVSFPEQATAIIEKYNIDLIQIPCNILDQRFVKSGLVEKLADKNIEIHVRSIFLQGLLLMETERIDAYFDQIKPFLINLKNIAMNSGTSIRKIAIGYIKSLAEISKVVVGVDNVSQLEQIICDWSENSASVDFDQFSISDEKFIVPSNWDNVRRV